MTVTFVDIHCHLLPGIDDGAKNWDESLAMARIAVEDGIATVIVTPHQLGHYRCNHGDEIRQRTAELQARLQAEEVPLTVLPGADVRIDADVVELLAAGSIVTLGDHRRHVLLELPHELYLPLESLLTRLARQNLVGILSHPERNEGILRQPAVLAPLVDAGCLVQVTAGSLCGTFGPQCQQFAEWLLTEGLVHFVATDAHGPRSRRPLLRRAFKRVIELTDEKTAIALCSTTPGLVANGGEVRSGRRLSARRRAIWRRRNPAHEMHKSEPQECRRDRVGSVGSGSAADAFSCAANRSGFRNLHELFEQERTEETERQLPKSSIPFSVTSVPFCSIFGCGRSLRWDISWLGSWAQRVVMAMAVLFAAHSAAIGSEMAWVDARQVGPFTIYATFPLAEHDRLFLELPELQAEISRTLGLPPARTPIVVYLFASSDEYRQFLQRQFPKIPFRTALYIADGGMPSMYTYRKPDLDIDLRHECTHAMLHSVLPVVPLWLDEGLAKYFEVPAEKRATGHPYFDDLRWKWSLRLGMVRTIEILEQRGDLAEMDAADYRSSWAWVHFMLHGPGPAHQALVTHLACYQQRTPAGRLSVRLAQAVPDPTEQMVQHFKRWGR